MQKMEASFFSTNTISATILKSLVNDAVKKIVSCGLNPICLVCDMGSNNQDLVRKLNVSEEQPYFKVDDQKVFFVHDPPHLLKCMRNNFKKYNVNFYSHKLASWHHIESLYEFDSKQTHRLVPKLTYKHVHVDGLKKMNVALAAQVLSNSVAAGLDTLSTLKYLPSEASFTADFCSKMNDLFESVNSRVLRHKSRPLLSACTKQSVHLNHWKANIKFIKSIKFATGNKVIHFPSLTGWIITLSAFSQTIPLLLESVPFILMSRFTQDFQNGKFFPSVRVSKNINVFLCENIKNKMLYVVRNLQKITLKLLEHHR